MKQRLHLLAMLLVATTMTLGLAACQDEKTAVLNLTGTTWEAMTEGSHTQEVQGLVITTNVRMSNTSSSIGSGNMA